MPKVPEQVRPPAPPPPSADPGEWGRWRQYVVLTSGCWIGCMALGGDGYPIFHARPAPGLPATTVRANRWTLAAYTGHAVPDHLVVRHTCDLSVCVRPDHLLTGEVIDNNHDRARRDRTRTRRRVGKADLRGVQGTAAAVRAAVLAALTDGVHHPDALAQIVTDTRAEGDPYAAQPGLFTDDPEDPTQQTLFDL